MIGIYWPSGDLLFYDTPSGCNYQFISGTICARGCIFWGGICYLAISFSPLVEKRLHCFIIQVVTYFNSQATRNNWPLDICSEDCILIADVVKRNVPNDARYMGPDIYVIRNPDKCTECR